jgi:hypothetical protein
MRAIELDPVDLIGGALTWTIHSPGWERLDMLAGRLARRAAGSGLRVDTGALLVKRYFSM